jgi:ABC-2 type transport system ATP-binding protein
MLTEPELLILDEPTAGLDVEATQEVLQLLRRLAEEAKVTILFSSHLLNEVEMLCQRVAILNQGRMVACERIGSLLSYDQTQIEVLLDGVEGAAKRLAEQSWVESVDVKPGRLHVHLREANASQLTGFLVNAGYQVTGVIPRRRTLQDYFLRVMNS